MKNEMPVIAFVMPLLLMALAFVLSSIPGQIEDGSLKFLIDLDPTLQNFLHVPLFGLMQFLWLRAFAGQGRGRAGRIVLSSAICLGYSAIDEVHQYFVPGRYASLMDVGLNLVGILLGTAAFELTHGPKAKEDHRQVKASG